MVVGTNNPQVSGTFGWPTKPILIRALEQRDRAWWVARDRLHGQQGNGPWLRGIRLQSVQSTKPSELDDRSCHRTALVIEPAKT